MTSLWAFFGSLAAGNFVARILLTLGVSFVTFQGLDAVLGIATSNLHGLLGSLPANVTSLLGLADLDFVINLILSAYAARLVMFAGRQMRLMK